MSATVLSLKLETQFFEGGVRHLLNPQRLASDLPREEVWEDGRMLGVGASGTVRLQSRQTTDSQGRSPLRAVKTIKKHEQGDSMRNYLAELEIAMRFSQPCYSSFFVKMNGWFENIDSIFIILEYFQLGNLGKVTSELPALSEEAGRQIARQLLHGVGFMHQNNISHRDLKPENILVAATTPSWVVKIADFGISKQLHEGTELRTAGMGTFGYMAPEIELHTGNGSNQRPYTTAVDIWSIGVIVLELLLKQRMFPNQHSLFLYTERRGLNISDLALTNTCLDFATRLLSRRCDDRPSAEEAKNHPWVMEAMEVDEPMFVSQTPGPMSQDVFTPFTPASQPWSTQSQALLSQYEGLGFDTGALLPCFQHLSIETTRYFVLRSDNYTDVESSAAFGMWTAKERTNKILDKAYLATGGKVVLFFSVTKSRVFCGVAQMTSRLDWEHTDEHWVSDEYTGRFTLNWLTLDGISYDGVSHVRVKQHTAGYRAISCYDGTEICTESGFELLQAFA